MENRSRTVRGFIDGQPCVIGRDSQIKIDDPALSRGHADIRLVGGKLILRDLESTNGTYLIVGNKSVQIDEVSVYPDQLVVLGSKKYRIKALLARVGIYVSYSEDIGLVIKSAESDQKTITIKPDVDELVSEAISELFK